MTEPRRQRHQAAHPVFVGGTQRSGTTILGRLIGRAPRFASIREIQFHTNQHGLADLLAGKTTPRAFVGRLRTYWWKREYFRRSRNETDVRGLFRMVEEPDFEKAVCAFETLVDENPLEAARRLVLDLIDPVAERMGKESWVETTPTTIAEASALYKMLPEMKLVHIVRDGRDVACSAVDFAWGPDDVIEAIRWWGTRLREADAGARMIPRDRILTLQLEDLVVDSRDASLSELVDFLEVADERPMRSFMRRQVTAEFGHIGRWRTEIPPERRDEATETYREVLVGLDIDGITCAPPWRD